MCDRPMPKWINMAMTEPALASSNGVSIARMTEHDLLEVVEIEESPG